MIAYLSSFICIEGTLLLVPHRNRFNLVQIQIMPRSTSVKVEIKFFFVTPTAVTIELKNTIISVTNPVSDLHPAKGVHISHSEIATNPQWVQIKHWINFGHYSEALSK